MITSGLSAPVENLVTLRRDIVHFHNTSVHISASAACGATGVLVLQTLHNTPGDAEDLAAKVQLASTHTERLDLIGAHRRRLYECEYCPERNYAKLMQIYDMAREVNTTFTGMRPRAVQTGFPRSRNRASAVNITDATRRLLVVPFLSHNSAYLINWLFLSLVLARSSTGPELSAGHDPFYSSLPMPNP